MKKHTFTLVFFAAGLFITACKKTDVQSNPSTISQQTTGATTSFKSVAGWTTENETGYASNSATIQDGSINSEVAATGMVLVYKKTANSVNALPYDEKAAGESDIWYYQVSEGSLTIVKDAYGSNNNNDQKFAYFVLSSNKLSALEAKGYSRNDLMKLTYEDALTLLK